MPDAFSAPQITETVAWLRDEVAHADWRRQLPQVASLEHFFDYPAEDAFLQQMIR
ncbi:hypothetical protein AB0F17_64620 [Nonomuraea sp. NPDC026600]|uniref:hypothetical protein n=1 Tax=Nonomuraea sp. NPDC026600 TaxID=3155363 RepID=UPI0033EB9A2A